jgi:ClpP class serine protease
VAGRIAAYTLSLPADHAAKPHAGHRGAPRTWRATRTVRRTVDPLSLLWIFFILASLQPAVQRQRLGVERRRRLARLSDARGATVITLIHRQETLSLLGFPIMRFIDIDDAESVLRAIQETPEDRPIEIVLHTPGGMVFAATQIASALADHSGRVTAIVPHYAMSGGTLIALAADEIVVDAHSALGPVDPQLGQYPAASIVAAAERPGEHDDQTLILADVGRKALVQVEHFTRELLERRMAAKPARDLARLLSTGTWTHDHPLQARDVQALGLPVRLGVPPEERELMQLYPQPRGREPSVEYAPGPAERPGLPSPRRDQRRAAPDAGA